MTQGLRRGNTVRDDEALAIEKRRDWRSSRMVSDFCGATVVYILISGMYAY